MRFLTCLFIGLLALSAPCAADDAAMNPAAFAQWLQGFKADALKAGISPDTLDDAFSKTEAPLEDVIELDRKQPEGQITFARYLQNAVSQTRIDNGIEAMGEFNELLNSVAQRYGVQKEFILALWGIETSYGENTGNFNVIDSLATLAFDGRRSDYFRGELISALKIMESEHMPAETMEGSWAGALGQCQFMPTTYLNYAVDFDADSKRNIWDDEADVFASIANYLHSLGWDPSIGWGVEVTLPAGYNKNLFGFDKTKPLQEWLSTGMQVDMNAAQKQKISVSSELSLADVGSGDDAQYYLVTSNYKAILQWNRSRYFATAVGTLSDNIK